MVTIKYCSHNFVLGSGFFLRSVTIRVHYYSSNRVCVQKKTKFVYKKIYLGTSHKQRCLLWAWLFIAYCKSIGEFEVEYGH